MALLKHLRLFLFVSVFLITAFFSAPALATATLKSTFTATASALSSIKQMRVVSDGTVYVLGIDTAKLVQISADGSTATNITYDVALPSHSGADFVFAGNTFYIAINGTPRLTKYTVSGTTATLIATVTPATGVTSISFGTDGSIYNTRGSTITGYDTNLNAGTSTTAAQAISRSMINASGSFYYLSTVGNLRKSTDFTSTTDSILLSSAVTTPLGISVSSDGTSYVANATTIKKINPAGTILWTKSLTNLAAMTVDSSGQVYYVNTSGTVNVYSPINAVSSFTNGTADSTSIPLNWTAGATDLDFSGVTIRRSTSTFPTSASDGDLVTSDNTDTSYTDTGLSPNTTYYYSIFNETIDGYYDAGTQISATTAAADTTPPDAPNISAALATPTGTTINLSWDVPATTSTFTLQRSSNGGGYSNVQTGIAASTTSYNDTGLSDGTYTYKLFALDAAGNISNAGTSSTLTVDTTAPNTPSISAALATPTGSTINLSWDVPASTSTFTLQRSIDSGGYATVQTGIANTTTTYNQTGLSDGTYTFKLFAVDAAGNISNAGLSSTLTVDTTVPSAVTGLSASATGTDVSLSWTNPIADFASITIRRSAASAPTGITDGSLIVQNITDTSRTDSSLSDGTYYYGVFAKDSVGNISTVTNVSVTVDTTAPSAPTLSASLATPTGTTINLSWNVPSSTATFMLRSSTSAYPTSSGGTLVTTTADNTTNTYADSGRTDGTYYYSLFALDSVGNISVAAQASATIDATGPSAPTNVSAEVSGMNVTLYWTHPADSDFDSITIRRSTVGFPATLDSNDLVASELTTTTLEDPDLERGTYYYSLFALDLSGNVSVAANVLVVTEGITPTIITDPATDIDAFGALLNGSITDIGTSPVSIRGFEYGETTDYALSVQEESSFEAEDFEIDVGDLECHTTYHYRAYATNETGTAYGEDLTFSTESCSDASDLTITIEAPTTSVVLNANATFVVSIANAGDSDIHDTTVTFTLSDNLEFVSAEIIENSEEDLSANPTLTLVKQATLADCSGTNPVSCNVGSVSAGRTLTLNVNAKAIAAGPMSLGAGATTEGGQSSGGSSSATSTATATALDNRSASGDNVAGCSLNPDLNSLSYSQDAINLFLMFLSSLMAFKFFLKWQRRTTPG